MMLIIRLKWLLMDVSWGHAWWLLEFSLYRTCARWLLEFSLYRTCGWWLLEFSLYRT